MALFSTHSLIQRFLYSLERFYFSSKKKKKKKRNYTSAFTDQTFSRLTGLIKGERCFG